MINPEQFQNMLGDTIFMGNIEVAGIAIYAVVLGIIFTLCKRNLHTGILLSIPLTLVFTTLGILSGELMILMIVIAVLVLAMGAKKTFGD